MTGTMSPSLSLQRTRRKNNKSSVVKKHTDSCKQPSPSPSFARQSPPQKCLTEMKWLMEEKISSEKEYSSRGLTEIFEMGISEIPFDSLINNKNKRGNPTC